jgi:hypothetical protein
MTKFKIPTSIMRDLAGSRYLYESYLFKMAEEEKQLNHLKGMTTMFILYIADKLCSTYPDLT